MAHGCIPLPRSLKLEAHELEANLGYIVRSCLKKKKKSRVSFLFFLLLLLRLNHLWTVSLMVLAARPKNTAEALEPSPTLVLQDVAKCISADGHPPGQIIWPSNVNGSHREMEEPGSQPGTTTVTSYLSMVPSRQADGKNITCRVEHESSQEPDQLQLTLSLPCECVCACVQTLTPRQLPSLR